MTQSTADIKVLTETLKTALGLVSKAMGKSSLPILSTIHISGSQAAQEISLSATDLETAVSMRVPASVAKDWVTCAPGETLTSLAGAAGGEFTEFTFEPESVTLRLKSQSMKSKLKCLEGSEFPIVAADDTQVMTSIPANTLRSALKRVVIAASADESRPVLCSVQLALIDEKVCLTAADGFRLATCRLDEEVVFPGKTSLIIPRASVLKLAAILPDDETPVQIAVTKDDRALIVSWGKAIFRAQLLDGAFPDWRAIFPKEWAHELTLSANAFQSAVRRAEIFRARHALPHPAHHAGCKQRRHAHLQRSRDGPRRHPAGRSRHAHPDGLQQYFCAPGPGSHPRNPGSYPSERQQRAHAAQQRHGQIPLPAHAPAHRRRGQPGRGSCPGFGRCRRSIALPPANL
jgi:DNA polymerase III subunit beta